LPCDPPVGVIHAMEGSYHASIARSVTPMGKSRECFRRPLGVRVGHSRMSPQCPDCPSGFNRSMQHGS
jgi:hypothetical protein